MDAQGVLAHMVRELNPRLYVACSSQQEARDGRWAGTDRIECGLYLPMRP